MTILNKQTMSISEKLKEYFKNNSKEQVLKDWEATKIYDSVNAPTVEQFLLHNVVRCVCKIPEPRLKVSENGTYAYCEKCAKTYFRI